MMPAHQRLMDAVLDALKAEGKYNER
jgi:hypothetical protein